MLLLDTTFWSCTVELLKAFLMFMSWRETAQGEGERERDWLHLRSRVCKVNSSIDLLIEKRDVRTRFGLGKRDVGCTKFLHYLFFCWFSVWRNTVVLISHWSHVTSEICFRTNWDADGRRVLKDDPEPLFPRSRLTLLNCGVQLGDLDGKSVNPILQRVRPQIEHVCLVEEFSEYVFSMFTFEIRGE